jgi:hypothetical protein
MEKANQSLTPAVATNSSTPTIGDGPGEPILTKGEAPADVDRGIPAQWGRGGKRE